MIAIIVLNENRSLPTKKLVKSNNETPDDSGRRNQPTKDQKNFSERVILGGATTEIVVATSLVSGFDDRVFGGPDGDNKVIIRFRFGVVA